MASRQYNQFNSAWEPYIKNYMPNNGFDVGGRLMAAWIDK
jgi:hypothetical protein